MKFKLALPLVLLFFACCLTFCNGSRNVIRYDLTKTIDSLVSSYKSGDSIVNDHHLCQAFPKDWDSIAILNPYEPFEQLSKFNLTNLEDLDDTLSVRHTDQFCLILFIKDRSITGYSKLKRTPLDFSKATPGDSGKFLIKRADCNAVYLKRTSVSSATYDVHVRR